MGFKTIKDPTLRQNWIALVDMAHKKLADNNISLSFENFKNNGSYGKAKAGLPGVDFAFCQDSDRTWVELDLKAKKTKEGRYPQENLYSFLQQHVDVGGISVPLKITWNEEDLRTSPRKSSGLDMKIKIYLSNPDDEKWVDAMLQLAQSFIPVLNDYKLNQ